MDRMRPGEEWWRNGVWRGPSFTWDLWYGCNYRCSYCFWEMDHLWEDLARQHKLLPPEDWLACWQRIYDRYGSVRIDVIGGEPLRYPSAVKLFGRLAARHRLAVTTNLSATAAELLPLLEAAGPDRLHIAASFHPEFTGLEPFTEKLLLLKGRGHEPHVLVVAWPPLLGKIMDWKQHFNDLGIVFTTQVFQGHYRGRRYPEAYTEAERELLGAAIPIAAEVKYRLEHAGTRGKPCQAGHIYANIKGNGDIYRCGQDCFGHKPLGNLFDPDFRMMDAPAPCPYEHCSCGEYAFLCDVQGENRLAGALHD